MSGADRKRKLEAFEINEIRHDIDGSVEVVAAVSGRGGGAGGGREMSLDEAKALLERAGIKKEKKKKKDKKEKQSKNEKKQKKSKKSRESSSSSSGSSESDSDRKQDGEGGGGSRQWMGSSIEKGGKSRKKKDKEAWGKPPGPEVEMEPISEDDYFLKNHEFAAWLKHARDTYFTDLMAEEARKLFKVFVAEWNSRRLPAKLYEGVTVAGRR